jgi:uncharacterized membrane protein
MISSFLARHHARLAISLLIGAAVALLVPDGTSMRLRAVFGWDGVSLSYLGFALWMLWSASSANVLRNRSAQDDQGKWMILILVILASFISLIAIGALLSDFKNLPPGVGQWHLAEGALTVLLSWLMMHTIFAVHYTHHFYGDTDLTDSEYQLRGGLQFPGNETPLFSDFFYYSFVIGMTCQVSDVQITARPMRQLSTVHGILSFLFNTIVLALSVNIAAGLVS